MATIQLFTPEELARRDQKPQGPGRSGRKRSPERQQIIDQFNHVLEGATPGFGGDVVLGEGEDKRIVRQNLRIAADDLGHALEFRPIKDKTRIHFRVITREAKAAKPKRGGRPRKQPAPEAVQNTPVEQPSEIPVAQSRRGGRRQTPQLETV